MNHMKSNKSTTPIACRSPRWVPVLCAAVLALSSGVAGAGKPEWAGQGGGGNRIRGKQGSDQRAFTLANPGQKLAGALHGTKGVKAPLQEALQVAQAGRLGRAAHQFE